MCQSWASSGASTGQWTACPSAHGGYGSPLEPAQDIWYHNRIGQLRQSSIDNTFLGDQRIQGALCQQLDHGRSASSWERQDNSISEALEQNWAQAPIGDPGMMPNGHSHAWVLRSENLVQLIPLSNPTPTGRKKETWKQWSYPQPPIP